MSVFDNSDTKKQGVSCTCKKVDGFGPIFAYLGQERLGHEARRVQRPLQRRPGGDGPLHGQQRAPDVPRRHRPPAPPRREPRGPWLQVRSGRLRCRGRVPRPAAADPQRLVRGRAPRSPPRLRRRVHPARLDLSDDTGKGGPGPADEMVRPGAVRLCPRHRRSRLPGAPARLGKG